MNIESFTPASTGTNVIAFSTALTGSVMLYGYMFEHTTNIFLSTNDLTTVSLTGLTAVDHFTNSRRVSAICPSFSGFEINTYTVLDTNRLIVNFYNISGAGNFDVILYNRTGYTKLSDEGFYITFI